jgi:DNA (cytosine-5)-methyltransferase 1
VTAYYNDHDPGACAWLRELIKAGLIQKGEVDDRSILDVEPADLAGFRSCHFFAGIGGWAYALRLAGWPDDRPVWTGSPPCQPFSAAGKGLSRDDPRHLAPHFVRLVGACRPHMLFGEQVASAEVFGPAARGNRPGFEGEPPWAWFDDLSNRLEAARYAVGASDIPAAGIGAPHIRQRTFFGAIRLSDADDTGPQGRGGMPERADQRASGEGGMVGGMADTLHAGRPKRRAGAGGGSVAGRGGFGGMADAERDVSGWRPGEASGAQAQGRGFAEPGDYRPIHDGGNGRPDPLDGFWRGADWLWCRDGKWRPVEPELEPLVAGLPISMGKLPPEARRLAEVAGLHARNLLRAKRYRTESLRGYGNSIVPWVAAQFVTAFIAATAAERTTP